MKSIVSRFSLLDQSGSDTRHKQSTKPKQINMNKFLHSVILAAFGIGCSLVWLLLKLPLLLGPGHPLPRFTELFVTLRPALIVLPIAGSIYCIWIWFRKTDRLPSWTGFFAVSMGTLALIALPAMIAAYLPLYDTVSQLARKGL
jgi:hypothetical protein